MSRARRIWKSILAFACAAPVFALPPWIPTDKAQHFAMGFGVGAAVNVSVRWSGGSRIQSAKVGFLVGTGLGLAKEANDWQANHDARAWNLPAIHSVEFGDFVATGLGAYMGTLAVHLLWPEPPAPVIRVRAPK